jgi:hypothetical protein
MRLRAWTVAIDSLGEMLTSEQVRSRGPICFSGAPFFHLEATISMEAASRLGATRLERTRSRHERHHRTTVRAGLEARGGASDEAIGRASATLPTGAFDHLPAVRLPPGLHEIANPLEVALAAAVEPWASPRFERCRAERCRAGEQRVRESAAERWSAGRRPLDGPLPRLSKYPASRSLTAGRSRKSHIADRPRDSGATLEPAGRGRLPASKVGDLPT